MIKTVGRAMNDFDRVWKRLIAQTDTETVRSYTAMEAIADSRIVPT